MNVSLLIAEIIGPDMLIVLAILAVLFGGSKIPQLARSLGTAQAEFRKGLTAAPDDHNSTTAE